MPGFSLLHNVGESPGPPKLAVPSQAFMHLVWEALGPGKSKLDLVYFSNA